MGKMKKLANWFNNQIDDDRKYIRLQKIITNLGGLTFLILFVFAIITKLYTAAIIGFVFGSLSYYAWRNMDKKEINRLNTIKRGSNS